jgi:hypothetical protein
MRKFIGAGVVVLAAATATAVALPPASAATRGWGGYEDEDDGSGLIEVCNHSGYLFDVYADGPSMRKDNLAGSFDECTNWRPVQAGQYQIGFGLHTPSTDNVVIQARFKRHEQTFYKVFNRQGQVTTNVSPGSDTRVDLFIPQG